MTGKNELTLNEATMIEIVQYYFDHVEYAPNRSPKVEKVTGSTKGFANNFTIECSEREQFTRTATSNATDEHTPEPAATTADAIGVTGDDWRERDENRQKGFHLLSLLNAIRADAPMRLQDLICEVTRNYIKREFAEYLPSSDEKAPENQEKSQVDVMTEWFERAKAEQEARQRLQGMQGTKAVPLPVYGQPTVI